MRFKFCINQDHQSTFATGLIVESKYYDFGPTFAVEKLNEEGYKVSKETLRKWLIENGSRKEKSKKKEKLYQSRPRRSRFGELVQIDGSYHDWFEGRAAKCCLLVFIDDATSRLIALRFVENETTLDYMHLIYEHIKGYGKPLSYYSDRHSIFKTTREDWIDGLIQDTQFQRALKTLGIMPICANSPQAKGRVERANKTLQDRLIKELRLKNISSMEEANAYLPTFIEIFNQKFSVVPKIKEDAHIKNTLTDEALQNVLSIHETRTLSKNLEFSYESTCYQITTPNVKNRLQHKKITLIHRNDGNIKIFYNEKELSYNFMKRAEKNNVVDFKAINAVVDELCTQQKASAP